MAKTKVTVLGGGISALTAIYYLTEEANWQEHYDITVYQMGWRLGGKVASGSNKAKNLRIEDSGVHFCMGFYENFFKMIRACYTEIYNDENAWKDVFQPENYLVFMENYKDEWQKWAVSLPPMPGEPGDGLTGLMVWEAFLELVQRLTGHYSDVYGVYGIINEVEKVVVEAEKGFVHWLEALLQKLVDWLSGLLSPNPKNEVDSLKGNRRITLTWDIDDDMPKPPSQDHPEFDIFHEIIGEIRVFVADIEKKIEEVENSDMGGTLRHDLMLLELGAVIMWGVIKDGVLYDGFRQLDHLDFADWLRQCGASDTLLASPPVRGLYEGVFSYEDGDFNKPRLAAGAGLYTMMRQFLGHNGALIYRMRDSTGINVFVPLYEVLKARGVKFEFFHRVKRVHWEKTDADDYQISRIEIDRQVDLAVAEYEPLQTEQDGDRVLQYWPTQPDFKQIEPDEAQQLIKDQINLEQYASRSVSQEATRKIELNLNTDFDMVILGIPVAALLCVCPDFGEANPKWDVMTRQVKTVSTQSLELWFLEDLETMGWDSDPQPIVATYVDPFSAWGDMPQLLSAKERSKGIKTVVHFAAVMADLPGQPPACELTPEDHTRAEQAVFDSARQWLNQDVQPLWPKATNPQNPNGLDWSQLYVFDDVLKADARLDDQYWRANIDPSIRYDQTLPGTMEARLKPDESGFSNLYLVGTWTDNGMNVSLMESGVMSGMLAASAISKKVTHHANPRFEDIVGVMDY